MGPRDVPFDVVQTVVVQLPDEFCTWDVLDHPYFTAKVAAEDARAAVGKFLREHASELGILYQKDRRGRKSSALFRKVVVKRS